MYVQLLRGFNSSNWNDRIGLVAKAIKLLNITHTSVFEVGISDCAIA